MKQQGRGNLERGSVSLILAATVLSFSLVILYQVSISNTSLNRTHSRSKGDYVISRVRFSLAQSLKNAYNLGQLNPTCSESIDKSKFTMRKFGAATLCIPKKEGLCTFVKLGEDVRARYCASTKRRLMAWDKNRGSARPGTLKRDVFKIQNNEVSNRINVPRISEPEYWRSCAAPATCVRLVVCPEDKLDCQINQAVSTQVVRLGPL